MSRNIDNIQTFIGSVLGLTGSMVKFFYGTVLLNIEFAKDVEATVTGALASLAGAIVINYYNKYKRKWKIFSKRSGTRK